MTINETFDEINEITRRIIESGLSIREIFPVRNDRQIVWQGFSDISIVLKNIPYTEKYKEINTTSNFNFQLYDYAIIQMMYKFDQKKDKLISHRLAYFPFPFAGSYDSELEIMAEELNKETKFKEQFERQTISFPIRFDFSTESAHFRELYHSLAHATFGEFNDCRIPLSAPLTPTIFMSFILRNFYNSAFLDKGEFLSESVFRHKECITSKEKNTLHFNIASR